MCASSSVRSSCSAAVIFGLMAFGIVGTFSSSDFEPGGKPEIKLINPDAEVIIGSVVNIRKRGSGLFGCGERDPEGVIKADALKWMVDELNKKLWSAKSANVSFGLYLMDSCSRIRTATSQLVEFLPELQSGEKSTGKHPFKLCVIDGVGLQNEADIKKSLKEINFPLVETTINTNSAKNLVNAVFPFLQELRWDRFALVHSSSKFGSSMLTQFIKAMKKSDMCVPWMINVENNMNSNELENIMSSGIPILSLLPTEEHSQFLENLQNISVPKIKVPVLFTDLVSRQQLKFLPSNVVQVFSVVPLPEREMSFESYYSKNSISNHMRMEDELDRTERTVMVRKIKLIGEKLSETLRSTVEDLCQSEERLCSKLLSLEGRNAIVGALDQMEWTDDGHSYQLVEYQFQFSDGHVHLHKIMSYNGHKNLDIYENKQIFTEINCEEENESKKECQCLEVKPDRTESARNIDDVRRKKKQPPKNNLDIYKNSSEMFDKGISQFLYQPMVYGSLNDPINGTLACLTLLGGLITLIIAQYFATFAALPNGVLPTGTSVLGYFILLGLFLLYTTNLSFLLTPLVSTCALRRFFIGFSYALVFSGMLIKVWSSLRQITSEKATVTKPFSLLLYAGAFTLIQGLLSGVWLILRPPATDFKADKWICYPPHGPDSHLIFSMIYPLILLVATIILSLQICSKAKNDEARWILISSSLVAIVLCCWAIAIGTRVWQSHRTPCTNLATATILLLCLYVPKIRKHSELKKALKSNITTQSVPPEMDKPCPVYATTPPTIPVFYGYNVMSPPQPVVMSEDIADPNYINQAYSFDESSETASTPFDMDSSSYSELEQEPYKFSTFLEEPRVLTLPQETTLDDPTQMIPSSLYSMDMFNTEPIAITSDHCQPGTNEFTPPHRATSQLYLCPQTEWVTHTDGV